MPLTAEENDRLTRVGPESPVGQVLRRYWTPAFLASDLPESDGPPIGVTVLGEDFVAFRNSTGRLGFLDELCGHRGASLTFGRCEEGGLRCLYHGWKFATDGTILETPNVEDDRILGHLRQGSYPVREAGGLGWVYLGPPELEPPFPHYPWFDSMHGFDVSEMVLDCNWVQVQEGSLDSSHLGLLHLDTIVGLRPGPRRVGTLDFVGEPWIDGGYGEYLAFGDGLPTEDNAPAMYLEDTPFGFQYAAVRRMPDPEEKYVRITALAMPYTAHIGGVSGAVIVVPRDDYSCSFIGVRPARAESPGLPRPETAQVLEDPRKIRFPQDARRYEVPAQHRRAMAERKSFAGFPGGNRPQDAAVQGVNARRPIYSRSTENLVPADAAVLRFRRLLLESARRVEEGGAPLGLAEEFDCSHIEAFSGVTAASSRWEDLVPGNGSTGALPVRHGETVTA